MERTTSYEGDANIGVFTRVLGDIAVIPPDAPEAFSRALAEALDVTLVRTTIQGSRIIGSLLAGNSRGAVVSGLAEDREIELIAEHREVMLIPGRMNAAGNVILANDSLGLVHPDMPSSLAGEIGTFLGIPLAPATLGGVKTVGMAGVATNQGIAVNPKATRQEIEQIEKITGIPVGTGSVNMGSGLVGTGLLANDHGYIAGAETTGFELGRFDDIFRHRE
jgi:translation initiation factor 6